MKSGKGMVLTGDALLATASAAALMALIFSFLAAPALMLHEDNFNSDFISVYKRASLTATDMRHMFEAAGKCGSVSDAQNGEKIYERCACGSSKLVGYSIAEADGRQSIIKVESCSE